jgi:uncharacterized membrane protein
MSEQTAVVALYATHAGAEEAMKELQRAGIDMRILFIVGKDSHTEEHAVGYYNTGDRMKYWGKRGAFWGGFWGLLFGSVFFAIPGIGAVLVAGPLVVWIVTSERAIADLNKRFLEHGVGCAFVDNELIRKDNEHLHQQAVLPALSSIL